MGARERKGRPQRAIGIRGRPVELGDLGVVAQRCQIVVPVDGVEAGDVRLDIRATRVDGWDDEPLAWQDAGPYRVVRGRAQFCLEWFCDCSSVTGAGGGAIVTSCGCTAFLSGETRAMLQPWEA